MSCSYFSHRKQCIFELPFFLLSVCFLRLCAIYMMLLLFPPLTLALHIRHSPRLTPSPYSLGYARDPRPPWSRSDPPSLLFCRVILPPYLVNSYVSAKKTQVTM